MSRNNFFSDTPKPSIPKPESLNNQQSTISEEGSSKKNKRITYSIKIDPTIRSNIKKWAIDNDVTISSVIEALARNYLEKLSRDDVVGH